MKTDDIIEERLGQNDAIEQIGKLLGNGSRLLRKALARDLCDRFNFYDEQGRRQTGGCLKALRALEAKGIIFLAPKNERLWQAVCPPQGVPRRADMILDLRLVLVKTVQEKKIWNELIIREHPLGLGWAVGRMVRYLVQSEHGILGAVGFGPSALELADRERWIGWNREQKRAHLQRVIGMNRFLIRPCVQCRNLASRVLSLANSRIQVDFEKTHHFRPWVLETFVDLSHYEGTCYQAANWVCIGKTRGRGRQDRFNRAEKTVKAVYVYVLEPQFRNLMGLERDAGDVAVKLDEDADIVNWAQKEFGGALLGDKRLAGRLVKIAEGKGAKPGLSYSQTEECNWAATMGFYRFVEHPDVEAVNMQSILEPHRQRTIRRMKSCRTVLCIQDTTDLDYSANRSCEGLGVIGKNQTATESRGLRLHSTMAADAAGVPLGILRGHCYAPALKPEHSGKDSRYISIEDKDTHRWIEAQADIAEVASQLPGVRVVSIADREGDFYEHFSFHQGTSRTELLIRAKNNRAVNDQQKMFEAVAQTPVRGQMRIHVASRSKRPKQGKRATRAARNRRDTDVVVRYMPVTMCPPKRGLSSGKPPVEVWLIHVHEPNPPPNSADPVNWYLLSTMPVNSLEDATQCVRWYCLRWRIEDWHRVLKSACRVEDIRLKTSERLKREIAIDMVVAWRIMLMSLLGREVPELPAEILFTKIEIETLYSYAKKKGLKAPENLGETVALIGRLGGYLGRRNDPPPGHLSLCKGHHTLRILCEGILLATQVEANNNESYV